jgi:hypothetical protein
MTSVQGAGLVFVGTILLVMTSSSTSYASHKHHHRRHRQHPSIVIPHRPRLKEEWYKGCPPWGSHGPDVLQDLLRNRIGRASHPRAIPFHKFAALPWPRDVTLKHIPTARWSRKDRRKIYRYLGEAVSVVGYLTDVYLGPPEPANCNGKAGYDWHLQLGSSPHTALGDTVVTEATPRVRAREHGFRLQRMLLLHQHHAKVRITGWLFLDSGHAHDIENSRITLWEVHPVTRVDVWRPDRRGHKRRKGHWVEIAG